MSSEDSTSRNTRTGRRRKTASKTSKTTSVSPRSSRRSRGVELPAPLLLLKDLSKILSRRRARWYLFGAQAVSAYGVARMTADVDVTVELTEDSKSAVIRALLDGGFLSRVDNLYEFSERTRVLPLFHEASNIPLDLVIAGDELEASILERAQLIDVGGLSVPVISRHDLIATKILAGRPKDLEDVRRLLEQPGVEVPLVKAMLERLDELLERSDLVPRFDGLIREIRNS
ncbi:MAG: nucleotidyl transferase AbiEii/AbiGii toxin family protein [Deltaproteobacteria bacterium]|nr:nucleotidyl transferase AbiEii/AbiGii toxin family protein [Deltaproteobacteria bacterium]